MGAASAVPQRNRTEGASALPKAGVQAQPERLICPPSMTTNDLLITSQVSSSCALPVTHRKGNMRTTLHKAIAASFLLCCLTLAAQESGMWRASNSTAKTITGDIILSEEKITINFLGFTMVKIRSLDKAEVSAAFDADSNANGVGSLYRLNIPGGRKFLHKNTFCGGEDTEWMATYLVGRSLQLVFFSGQKPPVLTLDAMANSTDLCGNYSYSR